MGKQKKNELDVILEQLKKSYATDSDEVMNDSTGETENEDDKELSAVLERIFSETDDKTTVDDGIVDITEKTELNAINELEKNEYP